MKLISLLLVLLAFNICNAQNKPTEITDDKGQTFFFGPNHALTEKDCLTFKSKDGKICKDAFIYERQVDGVLVAQGDKKYILDKFTFVKFEELPKDLQKKYDYRKKDLLKEFLNGEADRIEVWDDGFHISFDDGEIMLSKEQINKAIRDKFKSPSPELLKRMVQGIDGNYRLDTSHSYPFSGSSIEILGDKFTYYSFTDTPDPNNPTTPLSGKYTLENGWLHLDHPKLKNWSDYAFAMVNGNLVLMNLHHYPKWKKTGELPDDVLYWNKLK